jgi:hypothetical protein
VDKPEPTTIVRRRADGIPQILPVRARRRVLREPHVRALAVLLTAVALYATALLSAAAAVVLVAASVVGEAWRRRRPRALAQQHGAAEVLPLRLTASMR